MEKRRKQMDSKEMDDEVFRSVLELQLSELEMLNSMFPNEGELELTDPGAISDIQDFLKGNCSRKDLTKLIYTIHLEIQGVKVDVNVTLPSSYPEIKAEVSVHSGKLNRSSQDEINQELSAFQSSLEPGELYIGSLVEWVKEHFPSQASEEVPSLTTTNSTNIKCRFWVQSHHIYSKTKIKNIEDWAKELCLTGFILAGKPGFVCIEGPEDSCQIWWQRVRGMNWQKITCRLEERDRDQKFEVFANITAQIRSGEDSDMKAFFNYLTNSSCQHVFKVFFGFDGK